MSEGINRRGAMIGGLAAGIAASLPARLLAQAGESLAMPAAPAAPIFSRPEYHRRVLAAAAREKERHAGSIWRGDIVGVADFALPSAEPRFHFANLENGTVRSFFVAHGKGSDPEHDGWLKNFSNAPGSEATSRGAFLTCEWYSGKYGTSIRLVGLDGDNSLALDRAIVIHPAWYAAPDMIGKWGKLGRSEGCFAMAPDQFNEALWHLSGGKLLFADRIGLA